jgi:hypothetical protein
MSTVRTMITFSAEKQWKLHDMECFSKWWFARNNLRGSILKGMSVSLKSFIRFEINNNGNKKLIICIFVWFDYAVNDDIRIKEAKTCWKSG